jgi:hypothetical protein
MKETWPESALTEQALEEWVVTHCIQEGWEMEGKERIMKGGV